MNSHDDGHATPPQGGFVPPPGVLASFELADRPLRPAPEGWPGAVLAGDVVLSPVADRARATWSARVRSMLSPSGATIVRPFHATDGRVVVGGWKADVFHRGRPEARPDETVALSLRLHAALDKEARPRFLTGRLPRPFDEATRFVAADRAAVTEDWRSVLAPGLSLGEHPDAESPESPASPSAPVRRLREDLAECERLYGSLAQLRRETRSAEQIVHGDLFRGVLYRGMAEPIVPDLVPYFRSPSWAAGVIVIDALSSGEGDDDLPRRWVSLPEWEQQLLRAMLFRLGLHLIHPHSSPDAWPGLRRATTTVRQMVEHGPTASPRS